MVGDKDKGDNGDGGGDSSSGLISFSVMTTLLSIMKMRVEEFCWEVRHLVSLKPSRNPTWPSVRMFPDEVSKIFNS